MQPITIAKIDRSHTSTLSTFVTDIVVCDFVTPKVANGLVAILAESDIDEKIGKIVAWVEVVVCRFTPAFDYRREVSGRVPTIQFTGLWRFKVERCAEWDDTRYLER
jgi:hypothetical protein